MLGDLAQIAAAATWLMPREGAPWQWDENCEAVVWEDGTTIVFREELAQILERFASQGLPRSGALMLLLAACRGKVPETPDRNVDALHCLTSYPAALKSGVPARAALVMHMLPERDRSAASVEAVVNTLRSGLPFSDMLEMDERASRYDLGVDLAIIRRRFAKLNRKTIELLLQTGLPAAPEPIPELEVPLSVQVGNLLNHLLEDSQVAGIARVARQLMAAITLPEALSHAQEESLGGVSDIGNRGPLHRLLLSELAHDDDTLAVRLALNEALYTRHEPAASHPPSRLVLLVDVGVRMWGTPRVLAAAAALAFLAKAGKRVHPAVFRSAGDEVLPVKLWTGEGIVELLAALDTQLDAAAALGSLAEHLGVNDTPVDLVVVTHRATLEDQTFVERLPTGAVSTYAVGVTREGQVSIFTRTPRGLRPMNEARVDPQVLFSAGTPEVTLRDRTSDVPAIFRAEPFPFLLPPDGAVEYGWATDEGGGVCLTTEGKLWHWVRSHRGSVHLPAPALRGRTLGLLYARAENCWVAVKHHPADGELQVVRWFVERGNDKDAVESSTVPSDKGFALHAFTRAGFLYVVFRDHTEVISLSTGQAVGRGGFPPFARVIGTRFLDLSLSSRKTEFGIFYWDGAELSITTLHLDREIKDSVVLMFDRAGYEMPWVVDQEGRIFGLSDPAQHPPAIGRVIEAKASPSGHRVWMRLSGSEAKMASLDRGSVSWSPSQSPQRFFDGFAEPPRWTVRSRFTHIGLSATGTVMLRAQKGYYVEIAFGTDGKFHLRRHEDDSGVMRSVPFREMPKSLETDVTMRTADWPDGSRAFLDERGLLHLQSSAAGTPEVSFVLAESTSLPAWASDGRKVGPAYFVGEHQPGETDPSAIAAYVQQFANVIL